MRELLERAADVLDPLLPLHSELVDRLELGEERGQALVERGGAALGGFGGGGGEGCEFVCEAGCLRESKGVVSRGKRVNAKQAGAREADGPTEREK